MRDASEAATWFFGQEFPALVSPPRPSPSDLDSRGQSAFVSLSPSDPVLTVGGAAILQVLLHFRDLTSVDVTDDVVWTSSAPEVATVELNPGAGARLIARAPGVARLSASAGGKLVSTTVTVLRP